MSNEKKRPLLKRSESRITLSVMPLSFDMGKEVDNHKPENNLFEPKAKPFAKKEFVPGFGKLKRTVSEINLFPNSDIKTENKPESIAQRKKKVLPEEVLQRLKEKSERDWQKQLEADSEAFLNQCLK
ncbi:MAG: hypothetical protein K0R98_97 [Rickettsiaceae bacterium]|jgi:hypothetical protein|nr:hypothetical protein [Rickettsiaceae bacterium]